MEKLDLKKKKVTTHKIRKVLPYYKKSKGLLVALLIAMVMGGVLGIFSPIFSANALASLASEDFDNAKKYALIMTGLVLGKIIVNYFVEVFYTRINTRTKVELTKTIIDSINRTKMNKLDSVKLGMLSERLSSDVKSVSDSYLDMMNLIFDILTNAVFLIYIAYLNIYLFLILIGYVVVLYIICTIRSRVWIRGKKLTKKANEEAKSIYYQQITGIRDVKLLNMKESVTNYANGKFEEAANLDISITDKRNLLRRVQRLITAIFELSFMLIGIYFIKKEFILLAGFLVIFNYYGKVEWLVNYLSSFNEYNAEGEIAAVRIFEIVDDFEKEQYGTDTLSEFSGNIEFKNVNYSYSNNIPVLKNLSLKFEPNKMTAIVGKSGSGKTTILNLISKLYETGDGQIFLDGKDINTLTESSIRGNVGEISQSPYIFNASIRQNLFFAKPDASEEEMIEVLKKAQIYDDILKMENGLDTEIGENGVKVSGGQKQRIAIARLLLSSGKVIVFDEATSALDNNSQNEIVKLLESLKNDKTIIIVAHRLSTIIGADKIYMIDDGKVINFGTHKELMQNCNEYKELYEMEEKSAKVECL
ncbi:MAG: ABC transporter ATP-binding protein [Clostridia bacterium]|nr:ABC transporter ATP-binding protein [Clostridia bacterium]